MGTGIYLVTVLYCAVLYIYRIYTHVLVDLVWWLGSIYEKLVVIFFPLLYICLLCDEVLLPWTFGNPGFDVGAPRTTQIWKKVSSFHIFGLNLKNYNQIASLFDMNIDMGERTAGKQDRPSDHWRPP